MRKKTSVLVTILQLLHFGQSLPVLRNATREEIKRGDLLPPDHVAGAHMEQDGHINKDYHHEVFLGLYYTFYFKVFNRFFKTREAFKYALIKLNQPLNESRYN